jgi:hypothetical protein
MAMVGLTLLPNALLLVAPVAIFAVIRHARDRGFWLRSALGALAAMPLPVAIAWFYAAHPQRVVHNPMPLAFSVSQLGRALADLSVPLGHFVPIIDAGWPVLAGLTALVVVLCVRRDWPVAAAGAAGLVLLVGSLGVTRVELDLHSVFFPASRYYLAVPVLGAVLAAQVAQTASGRLGLAARLPTAAVVLLLACAIGLVVRSASLDAATERALAKTYPVFVARVDELRVLSRELAVAAESCDADLVLVSDYPLLVFNYGVPVLTDGRVETLFPTYERRTWRLAHETRAVRPRMMVMTGGRPDIERNLQRLGAQRLAQLPGLWCVEAGGRTPLEIARLAGIEVRDRGIDPTTVPVP